MGHATGSNQPNPFRCGIGFFAPARILKLSSLFANFAPWFPEKNNKERVFRKERKPTICPGARSIVDRMDEIKRRGRPESARLNTGRSVTRRNSGNGALLNPDGKECEDKSDGDKGPGREQIGDRMEP
jgi:hypothetical protein